MGTTLSLDNPLPPSHRNWYLQWGVLSSTPPQHKTRNWHVNPGNLESRANVTTWNFTPNSPYSYCFLEQVADFFSVTTYVCSSLLRLLLWTWCYCTMEKCHVKKQSQIGTTNVWGFEWLGCRQTQWGGGKAGAFIWTCNQTFLFPPVSKESLGDLNLLFWSTLLVWCDCQPQMNSADTSSSMRMCGNVILNWIFLA